MRPYKTGRLKYHVTLQNRKVKYHVALQNREVIYHVALQNREVKISCDPTKQGG